MIADSRAPTKNVPEFMRTAGRNGLDDTWNGRPSDCSPIRVMVTNGANDEAAPTGKAHVSMAQFRP
jgi:hypothetical protein